MKSSKASGKVQVKGLGAASKTMMKGGMAMNTSNVVSGDKKPKKMGMKKSDSKNPMKKM